MMLINIPDNNIPEREYVIDVIFSQFLGLSYKIEIDNLIQDYSIEIDGAKIIFRDHFFSKYPKAESYLCQDAIPESIIHVRNQFTIEADVPVIYGTQAMDIFNNQIICGIDVFASSYFMLTRWEEYVNKKRDIHSRFPVEESVAWKNNLLPRPIVNEYVEMLWNMLVYMGYNGQRKEIKFEMTLTHDIDLLTRSSVRTIFGDVVKRKDLRLALQNLKYLYGVDPCDTYDFLMSVSEKLAVKSHFYFMATDSGRPYDTGWYLKRRKFKSVIRSIKDRGHLIGFHPGYYTYNDPQRWVYEKTMLEEAVGQSVTEGRQHFLRFEIPGTLNIWNDNNMVCDSTLGYSHKEGFRCGTGNQFYIFDFLKRKKLNLLERPLIIMDGTLKNNTSYNKFIVQDVIHYYIAIGEKYKTGITMLFHNSSFYHEWDGYFEIYSSLVADV